MYVHTHTHTHTHVCVCVYIYIYTCVCTLIFYTISNSSDLCQLRNVMRDVQPVYNLLNAIILMMAQSETKIIEGSRMWNNKEYIFGT